MAVTPAMSHAAALQAESQLRPHGPSQRDDQHALNPFVTGRTMNFSHLRRTLLAATIGAACVLAAPRSRRTKWPSKPITYVVAASRLAVPPTCWRG